MANAPAFASILDQPAADAQPPKPLPQGSYITVLQGLPESITSSQKKTPGLRFTHRILSALDDVDPGALAEFPDGVAGKTIRNDLWLTEDSKFMLTQFLENCGIDLEGKSYSAAIDETPNAQVGIYIKHTSSDDGQRMYANVGRTFAVD